MNEKWTSFKSRGASKIFNIESERQILVEYIQKKQTSKIDILYWELFCPSST